MDYLQSNLDILKLSTGKTKEASEGKNKKPEQFLDELTLEGVGNYIKSGRCSNIVVLTGAGISTASGIPDFRTPGTGLFYNLQKYNLPNPKAIFEINFFRSNPGPFFALTKEMYPGNFLPTTTHYFFKMLHDKGLLLRDYTQNIDTLDRIAGVPLDALVEVHGSFHYPAECLDCKKEYQHQWIEEEVFADKIPRCVECKGLVKPGMEFFGEWHMSDGEYLHECTEKDMPICDLLIVLGTSLVVQPFASLIDRVPKTTPRLLINLEKCGQQANSKSGFQFDSDENYRDVFWQGTTDNGCMALADMLGWKDELLKLVETEHKRLGNANKTLKSKGHEKGGEKCVNDITQTDK